MHFVVCLSQSVTRVNYYTFFLHNPNFLMFNFFSESRLQNHLTKLRHQVDKFQYELQNVKPTPECKCNADWNS